MLDMTDVVVDANVEPVIIWEGRHPLCSLETGQVICVSPYIAECSTNISTVLLLSKG